MYSRNEVDVFLSPLAIVIEKARKFDESKVKRAKDGKFGSGGSGGGSGGNGGGSPSPKASAKKSPPVATPAKQPVSSGAGGGHSSPAGKSPNPPKPQKPPTSSTIGNPATTNKEALVPEKKPSNVTVAEIDGAKYGVVKADIQRYSEEHNEPVVASGLKGEHIPGNGPTDVELTHNGRKLGVEVKTFVGNKLGKVSMKKSAKQKKATWVENNKDSNGRIDMVVLDDDKVFNANGEGKHDDSKRKIYYRRGFGSYSIKNMHPCKDFAEVRKLMIMPDDKLPPQAREDQGFSREERGAGDSANGGKAIGTGKKAKMKAAAMAAAKKLAAKKSAAKKSGGK